MLLALLQFSRARIDQKAETERIGRHNDDKLLFRRIGEGTKKPQNAARNYQLFKGLDHAARGLA
jgi:hypothetical protein